MPLTSGFKLLIKSATNSLPITVLVAPKSTIPWLPWDAKQTSLAESAFRSGNTIDAGSAFLRLKRCAVASLVSFLETKDGLPKWGFPCLWWFWRISLKRSLLLGWFSQNKLIPMQVSSTVGIDTGNSKNSSGKPSKGWSLWLLSTWTNEVIAWEDVLWELDAADCRCGHSAFQCPILPHMRQRLSRILCCRVFLDAPFPFPLKFLPPLFLPFEEGLIGQKPQRNFSLRRLLASV